tara:strand:+ start:715 stop:1524 length:810 start_codon:yes stop_codon:yes gene_type:complete
MSNPSDQILKQDILKDIFSWEIPVDNIPLPSQGKIYNPNSKLYNAETVAIKAMTAKEEDILSSRSLIKDGKVIDELIKSCLIDKSIDVDELIAGDKNALMVSIRITGYGSAYNITANCTDCDYSNKLTVDLSSLEIKTLEIEPVRPGENLFKYKLPVSKKEVLFKFLTGKNQKEIQAQETFQYGFSKEITKNVTNFLFSSIEAIDNVTDKNKIKKFVDNMPAYDSKSLRTHINKNEPNILMQHNFNCQKCNADNSASLPMTINFFWPAF